ncbi:MAG: hypothetical protein K2Y51_18670 [Gammaproteobacteria bacterium]|jgi:hypothetical protein|nr:hypothetical protein [Gammaproteobacteria bacterium]
MTVPHAFTRLAQYCIVLAALLAGCGESAESGPSLELRLASGWTYVGAAEAERDGDTLRFAADALDAALAPRGAAALFAALKHAPPHAGHNPTFGVSVERRATAGSASAVALLEAQVEAARRDAGFTVVRGPQAVRVADHDAASATLRAPGPDGIATRIQLTLLPLAELLVQVTATDAASGAERADAEIDAMLASLVVHGAP